jgi:hypothetical protein
MNPPAFSLSATKPLSNQLVKRGISDFAQACSWVAQLPYGRNPDKDNPHALFLDGCGTCSTKHALLKRVAIENDANDIRLMMGIFPMNGQNTPAVASVLNAAALQYIPEAHVYLRWQREMLDFTFANTQLEIEGTFLLEKEINPDQCTHEKGQLHREFLQGWLNNNPQLNFSLDAVWEIRERCINVLMG